MSEKKLLTLTVQDETTIAKLLVLKSLKGFAVEAWTTKEGRHVVNILSEERRSTQPRFEIRLIRDGAEAEFRQAPTNQNIRSLRGLIEQRGLAEIDLTTFARVRQYRKVPLATDEWQDGLRRAVAQLRGIYLQRIQPLREQVKVLQTQIDEQQQKVGDLDVFLASKVEPAPAAEVAPLAAE